MIFIKILNCALYPTKCFVDADAIAKHFGASLTQAKRVFDTCVKHKVLQRSGYGYNARQWLIDNKFLGKYDKTTDEMSAFNEGIGIE